MDTRSLLSGIAIGAATALILDPGRGGRRPTMRDVANRTRGFVFETGGWPTESEVDDARLLKRVRARLGRAASHPHAIEAAVQDGQVTLRGPILASEVQGLLSAIARVRGVQSVLNELEAHDTAENVPALQDQGRRSGPRFDVMPRNWAPGTRALVGAAAAAAGGLALAYARR